MKNKKEIEKNIALKRFKRKLVSRDKKSKKMQLLHKFYLDTRQWLEGDTSIENVIDKWMPTNLAYLLSCEQSDFHLSKIVKDIPENNGLFPVPKNFSLIDYPEESFRFIQNVLGALLTQKYSEYKIDYSQCSRLDLGAQVFFDILMKDILKFFNRCRRYKKTFPRVTNIQGTASKDINVDKLLYSVGSPVIHSNKSRKYPDIVPYELCIHDREVNGDPVKIREQKDLDTTKLVDYVLEC